MATLQLYGKFGANVLGGEAEADAFTMDFLTDVIKATLHNNTYVPAIDTHEVFADATNELTTANGYTAGGVTLGTKTAVYNATGNITTFDAADFGWTASGGDLVYRYVVFWRDSTTDPLIGYLDQTGSGNFTLTNGNTVTFQTGANGLFQGTVT
jgi:hypothetical protein